MTTEERARTIAESLQGQTIAGPDDFIEKVIRVVLPALRSLERLHAAEVKRYGELLQKAEAERDRLLLDCATLGGEIGAARLESSRYRGALEAARRHIDEARWLSRPGLAGHGKPCYCDGCGVDRGQPHKDCPDEEMLAAIDAALATPAITEAPGNPAAPYIKTYADLLNDLRLLVDERDRLTAERDRYFEKMQQLETEIATRDATLIEIKRAADRVLTPSSGRAAVPGGATYCSVCRSTHPLDGRCGGGS